jgi:hypothetical protein
MISKPVFTTNKKKISYFEYIFTHCLPTGFSNFKLAISLWFKLLQGDYSDYQIYNSRISKYSENELFEMLRYDFWDTLEDDVLDKEFLEYLIQLKEEVNLGELETVPWDFDKFLDEMYEESE